MQNSLILQPTTLSVNIKLKRRYAITAIWHAL